MLELGVTPGPLFGSVAYVLTACMAMTVAEGPWRRRIGPPWRWRVVAAVFLALAIWRIGLFESRLQDDVREWARQRGLYEQRRSYQEAATLLMLAGSALAVVQVAVRGGFRRSTYALGAAGALAIYSLVRLVSLHELDSLLFRTGPIHLNYLIDMGLTAAAAGMAWLEIRAARAPTAPNGAQRGPK
jgi:hypothetical protein